jgi:hypothetical protein
MKINFFIDIWYNRLMTGLTRDSVADVSGASKSNNSKNMRKARQFGRLLESVDDVYQKTNCSCQLERSRHSDQIRYTIDRRMRVDM